MKSIPLLAFVSLGLGLLVSGCNSAVRPDSIVVSVADLKAADATLLETRLIMTVRFTSESVTPFGLSGSSYKLYLNGDYAGRAVSSTPVGLPSLGTVTQDVTLILENAALVKQVLSLQRDPVVRYRLDAVLFTKTGDDERRVKTSFEGTLDLHGLPLNAQ